MENPEKDRSSFADRAQEPGADKFASTADLLALKDVYRHHTNGNDYSHFAKRFKTQSQIDRIYSNQALVDCIKDLCFHTVSFSDHKIVSAAFCIEPFHEPRGPSYWKLNSSILPYEAVKNAVSNAINDSNILYKNGNDFLMGWEQLKMELKHLLIELSLSKATETHLLRQNLEGKLEWAKQALQLDPNSKVLNTEVNGFFAQITKMEIDRVKGTLIHSHYRDVCLDRCTLTTAKKLQKKSAENRHFYAIQKKNGQI